MLSISLCACICMFSLEKCVEKKYNIYIFGPSVLCKCAEGQ